MLAIRIHTPGGHDALVAEQLPVPRPGAGQALVAVDAAGVNFIDTYQRSGLYKLPLPCTLGQEGAGIVQDVGEGVTTLVQGDRVVWASVLGAYAEFAVVPADRLVKVPDGVTTREAAAVFLQGLTAHYLAKSTWPLKPGDICLVHAAAGGVGLLLVQIAELCGARVIGVVSTEEKAALAREAGADDVIVTPYRDLVKEVRELTKDRGVDVVYDGVGAATFEHSLACLRPRGMLVSYGNASGPVPPMEPLRLSAAGSLFLTRPTLAHYIATRDELESRATDLLQWVREGMMTVRVHREYPLAGVAEAHRDLESRATSGKLLLVPS